MNKIEVVIFNEFMLENTIGLCDLPSQMEFIQNNIKRAVKVNNKIFKYPDVEQIFIAGMHLTKTYGVYLFSPRVVKSIITKKYLATLTSFSNGYYYDGFNDNLIFVEECV